MAGTARRVASLWRADRTLWVRVRVEPANKKGVMPRSGGAGGPIAPETPVDAIPGIVASARAAFDTGKTRPLKWRVQQLEAIIRLCEENKDAITRAIQADLGRAE